jgi:hypothetical protein
MPHATSGIAPQCNKQRERLGYQNNGQSKFGLEQNEKYNVGVHIVAL